MRSGQSWSYDADTFGICDCAYVLLFGKDISIRQKKGNRWQQSEQLKRYWNKDIWNEIFNSLLNLDEDTGSPIGSRAFNLRRLQEKINTYLEQNLKQLHCLLSHHANNFPDSRDKIK
jgi:checkpoint serine/threonine-protein kinase